MSPNRLFPLAGLAGLACALLLVVNAARRGGLLPDTDFTESIAPLAALAGLFALTGLYLWQRAEAGVLGLIGYILNAAGLAGAFAIEYALHFVLRYLDTGTVDRLVDGGTGTAFRATAIVLISGVLAFSAASLRARRFPPVPVALYALGMVPGSLRNAVPEPAYLTGLLLAAAAVAWLSLPLLRPHPALAPAAALPR
jgi:hypothetical protein